MEHITYNIWNILTYTQNGSIVYQKFQFNWAPYILSDNQIPRSSRVPCPISHPAPTRIS